MPIADTKKVQSLIQGFLIAQTDIENALSVLIDNPGKDEVLYAYGLLHNGFGILGMIRSRYITHSPNLAGTNLNAQNVSDINAYYNNLKQIINDNGDDYATAKIALETSQTTHAAIISTMKAKNHPTHGHESLN